MHYTHEKYTITSNADICKLTISMKTYLVGQAQKLGLYYRQVEHVKFLGKELKVIKGTSEKPMTKMTPGCSN